MWSCPLAWPRLCGRTKMKLKIAGMALFIIFLLLAFGLGNNETSVESELYTVQEGDNLWQIASERWEGDPREGVWWMREANKHESPVIYPGQTNLVPKKEEETE